MARFTRGTGRLVGRELLNFGFFAHGLANRRFVLLAFGRGFSTDFLRTIGRAVARAIRGTVAVSAASATAASAPLARSFAVAFFTIFAGSGCAAFLIAAGFVHFHRRNDLIGLDRTSVLFAARRMRTRVAGPGVARTGIAAGFTARVFRS